MEAKSLSDCYFYYYSSCTKGDDCPYRHCKEALGTERLCNYWKQGRCFRSNCKFRHMETRGIDRNSTPCYWENQPGGCRKPHCVFLHVKPKVCNEPQELILPVSSGQIPLSHAPVPITHVKSSDVVVPSLKPVEFLKTDEKEKDVLQSSFVVSLNENEESDSESITSTPVKSNDEKSLNIKGSNLASKLTAKNLEKSFNFEIKSLEQIRLEKIHKESANIYKTDYEVPTLEELKKKRVLGIDQIYPPTSDFIGLQSDSPLGSAPIGVKKEVVQGSIKNNIDLGDLRVFLKQPKEPSAPRVSEISNKIFSTRKKINQTNDSLEFKIKTLEEIRKEKKFKKEAEVENGDAKERNSVKKISPKTRRRLKIDRKSSLNSSGNLNEGLEGYLKDRANIQDQEETIDFYCKETETVPKAKRRNSELKSDDGMVEESKNKRLRKESFDSSEENDEQKKAEVRNHTNDVSTSSEDKEMDSQNTDSFNTTLDTTQDTLDTTQETLDTTQDTLDTTQDTLDTTQINQNVLSDRRSISTDNMESTVADNPKVLRGQRSVSTDDMDDTYLEEVGMEEGGDDTADDDILSEINKFLES